MRKETIAIRTQSERSAYKEHAAPIYMTSSYAFDDAEEMRALFADEKEGNIYSRYSNPNTSEFIDKMVQLEGAENGWATASGMAAVFSTFGALLKQGDHIVSCRSVFGSTHKLFTEILPKFGIKSTYVDFDDYKGFENAVLDTTKIIYLETPSNPGMDIIDLSRISKICKSKGVLLVVDNCFATPILQQPIKHGADIVIHSATKFIDGQGRSLGGVIVGKSALIQKVKAFARHTGPCLSPFNAWLLSKSLETLDVRLERHCKNALSIATWLEEREEVNWVKYPFLKSHPQYDLAKKQMAQGGGVITFEINGGIDRGKRFLNQLKMFSLTANLGDTRSIATHPASTTHSKLMEKDRQAVGITDGLIRLSIGLEHVEDIKDDLAQAFSQE